LILSAIIGRVKAWTYVAWVALFSLLSGLLFGAWVDGTSIWRIMLYLAGLLAVLGAALTWAGRRKPTPQAAPAGKS